MSILHDPKLKMSPPFIFIAWLFQEETSVCSGNEVHLQIRFTAELHVHISENRQIFSSPAPFLFSPNIGITYLS